MRWIIYILAVLAAALVAGLIVAQRTNDADEQSRVHETLAAVERLKLEIHVRRALETADLNAQSWPARPDPEWFPEGVPMNEMVDRNRPWLEVAPQSQANLDHPPVRVAGDPSIAAFWYNPYRGVVRARAPKRVSDKRSTELYNAINATRVSGVLDMGWLALDEMRHEVVRHAQALAATNMESPDEVESLELTPTDADVPD